MLERDLVSPAGFATLPRLVRLAPRSAEACGLAGKILSGRQQVLQPLFVRQIATSRPKIVSRP